MTKPQFKNLDGDQNEKFKKINYNKNYNITKLKLGLQPNCNNAQVVTNTHLDKLRFWHNTNCDKTLIVNNIILGQKYCDKTQNVIIKFLWRLELWQTQNVKKKET